MSYYYCRLLFFLFLWLDRGPGIYLWHLANFKLLNFLVPDSLSRRIAPCMQIAHQRGKFNLNPEILPQRGSLLLLLLLYQTSAKTGATAPPPMPFILNPIQLLPILDLIANYWRATPWT